LKRRSTRHVSEITSIASEFGNSAKIIVPRSWRGTRVIAFLHSEYISKHSEERSILAMHDTEGSAYIYRKAQCVRYMSKYTQIHLVNQLDLDLTY
jgi:hypothetical protein